MKTLKDWVASEVPELLLLRARKLYEQRGYSRRWIDKRLRAVSTRHELTSEWYRRGARNSAEFRLLTNQLFRSAFGMDAAEYRRYKGLSGSRRSLRDHMTDLELALTSLAETTAAVLHRSRSSSGIEQLLVDVADAGEIVAGTASDIERRSGRKVVESLNHLN